MLSLVLVLSLIGSKSALPPLKAPTKAKTGTIVVNSLTQGTKVFLDEKPAGSAPATLKDIPPGEHKVKLKRLGYLMSEETVVVEAGKTVEVQIDLLPYAGILTVKTQPKGAQVFVDGKGVGVVPFEGEISIGRRAVEVKKDGFQTYREVFQVGAGETYKIDVTLKKGEAEATADVPLAALAPKKKADAAGDVPLAALTPKKKAKKDDTIDIPLEAPPSLAPKTTPLGLSQTAPPDVSTSNPNAWYKQWWVWTIAGAVVATAVIVPIAVTAQSGPSAPPNSMGCTGVISLDAMMTCHAAAR
jgi:hypothetical protein